MELAACALDAILNVTTTPHEDCASNAFVSVTPMAPAACLSDSFFSVLALFTYCDIYGIIDMLYIPLYCV